MLPVMFEKCKHANAKVIADVEFVCITTDCWSSVNNDRVIGVTGHFVSHDFVLKSVFLDCVAMPQSHTSENLAAELKKVVSEWGLDKKVVLGISDNASNIVKAIKEVLQWNFLGCMAHTINLVVETAIKHVEALLSKIKAIASHFKRSALSNEKLINYQRNSGLEPKKLLQDVSTRWNSTYLMLQRFCELEEAIKSTVALIDKQDLPVLNHLDWKMAKELIVVLKPFFEATKGLSGEKYSTSSIAIVLSNGLTEVCKKLQKKKTLQKMSQL